jgi:amino acid adenylation domain-containing protein
VRSYPLTKWLDKLIEEQIERSPHAVAAVFEGEQLTYRQLGDRANRLARHLHELGVGRHTLVAICVERSAEMLVGLLGILKAGGAYLPLDPMFPRERLAFMLKDAQPLVLLTQRRLLADVPEHQAQAVCLDELPSMRSGASASMTSLTDRSAEDLAYVLYTSGSTGKPKGVQIQHRALVNFLSSMKREPGITARDSLLAITTLSFDIAGLELYLPLTVGARVVVASSEVATDGQQLLALMKECKPTIMQATPATWRMLLDSGWNGSSRLKILCGGESWGSELSAELLPRCQSLWNMYGPTETTIWSAVARVEKDQPVSIGHPIDNTTFYILDGSGQSVPVGVPGELHIGGTGLALGYLGRPDLTSERFIADPFTSEPGARLYKTGDIVQRIPGGSIEFIRRADHQVKLRGFRIELGEIEALLERQAGVRQCVVTVRGDDLPDQRLVAYIVPADPQARLNVEDLRGALRRRLPSYMIPTAFAVIEKMPLTHNGKIDRRELSLRAVNYTEVGLTTNEVDAAPLTPTEMRVKGLWDEILGVPNLSVRDNFFESGGDSLLAMQLIAAIHREFRADLSLQALFFAPTIQSQAKAIDEIAFNGVQDHVVPLQKGDTSRHPLFLIHSYHLYPVLPKRLGKDQPVYGIQERSTHVQMDDWALESMMARYVEAIRSVQPHGPYFIGGFCSAAVPAFEVARQLREAGELVPLLAIIDAAGYHIEMDPPRNRFERLRLRWKNTQGSWRFNADKPKLLQAAEIVAALRNFATILFQNQSIKLQNWWWGRICRFYMRRHLRMPGFILGKLVAGIRIVTLEASRNYSLRPYEGDIAVFLAAGSNFPDREDSISPWAQTTSGKAEVVWLPGDHTTAFTPPNINIFAEKLRNAIDAAVEQHRTRAGCAAGSEEAKVYGAEPIASQIPTTER